MSGGHFDYSNDHACNEIFHWLDCDYGMGDEKYLSRVKAARKFDPMEDKQLSELVYDVFCLLHSLDWYVSCDTCEATYRKDVDYFKKKWFRKSFKGISEREVETSISELREELFKILGIRTLNGVDEETLAASGLEM